jgi:hypothetical protein
MPSSYRDYGKRRYGFVSLLLAEIRVFSLFKSAQTGSAAYKASYSMETGTYFQWKL